MDHRKLLYMFQSTEKSCGLEHSGGLGGLARERITPQKYLTENFYNFTINHQITVPSATDTNTNPRSNLKYLYFQF